jgi:hypothetical protein
MDHIQLTDAQLVALIAGQIYASHIASGDKQVPNPEMYGQIKPVVEKAYNLHLSVKAYWKENKNLIDEHKRRMKI